MIKNVTATTRMTPLNPAFKGVPTALLLLIHPVHLIAHVLATIIADADDRKMSQHPAYPSTTTTCSVGRS